MDKALNFQGRGAWLIFANLDRIIIEYALKLHFMTSNNGTGYEAMIMGLRITKELKMKEFKVFTYF